MKERDDDLKASVLKEEKAAQEAADAKVEAVNRVKFDDVDTMQERLSRMSVRGYNSDREPPLMMTPAQIKAFESRR